MIYYSASTNGFYDPDIHDDAIPEDAVTITRRRHKQLLAGQAGDATIVPGKNGRPALQRASVDERRGALHKQIKSEAARRIEEVSPLWRQNNDLRAPSAAGKRRFDQIDAIRGASDRIGELLDDTRTDDLDAFLIAGSPLWPEFD